jgi:hypothetical protein
MIGLVSERHVHQVYANDKEASAKGKLYSTVA